MDNRSQLDLLIGLVVVPFLAWLWKGLTSTPETIKAEIARVGAIIVAMAGMDEMAGKTNRFTPSARVEWIVRKLAKFTA